ncbi:MAG: hypothetical protein ACOYU7_01385 [Bacillota bacterium]
MTDAVERNGGDAEAKAFPGAPAIMLVGAFLAGIGLFLIGAPTPPFVKILGFLLFLVGVIIFAL